MANEKNMNESCALSMSTGWINGKDGLYGYLPLSAANFLVGSGKYIFYDVSFWGYVIKIKNDG